MAHGKNVVKATRFAFFPTVFESLASSALFEPISQFRLANGRAKPFGASLSSRRSENDRKRKKEKEKWKKVTNGILATLSVFSHLWRNE